MKITVTKDGVTQEVKERYLQNFIDRGWTTTEDKVISKVGKAKATADILEEDIPQIEMEEEETSNDSDEEGEE